MSDQKPPKRARTDVSPHGSRVRAVLQCRNESADAPVLLSSCVRTTQAEDDAGAAAGAGDAGTARPAVAGAAAATPPSGRKLPKDPTEWTVDQVQQWLIAKGWSADAGKFKLNGEKLCKLTEEQIKTEVPGLRGSAIFNDIAELKKQASSSSSESSPGSAAGTAAALTAPLAPCCGCVSC
jgi:hypothetical protein